MGKENIVNDYWICRTIMGTIVLEEEISNKTRNFLYQIVTPKKISEVFRVLNETMPMDFYDLADFYNELNNCMSQFWVEKVDEPQQVENEINVEDIDIPDTWGVFAVSRNMKDKSKSESEMSETMFDDFGNPRASASDLKYWLEKEVQEQQEEKDFKKIEFKKENKELVFNYNVDAGFKNSDSQEGIPELPEENPFFRENTSDFTIGNEFEIPINEEAKKLLDLFKGTSIEDFKDEKANYQEDTTFFPSNSNNNLKEMVVPEVEIGETETIEKINKTKNQTEKNRKPRSKTKKTIPKKTFFEKILALFKK